MAKVNLWHIITLIMFIPAIVGLFIFKTFLGAMLVMVSTVIIAIIGSIFAIIEKKTPLKYVIVIDIVVILLDSMIIAEYYFKRSDIGLCFAISGLVIMIVFCESELIKKRKNNNKQ